MTCGQTYYYRVATKDAGDTTWYSSTVSASTATCGSGGGGGITPPDTTVPSTDTGEVTATPSAGGETTLTTSDGATAKITVPASAVSSNTTVTITESGSTDVITAGSIGSAPGTLVMVGNTVYNIVATDADGNAVTDFSQAVTLTFTYTDDQIAGLDEDGLVIYYWDGTEWVALTSTVDAANNTITATTTHFSYFAIIGESVASTDTVEGLQNQINIIINKIAEIKAQLINLITQKIAEIQTAIDAIKAQLVEMGGTVASDIPTGFTFENDLKKGMTSDDVKYLQIILKREIGAPTYPDDIGATGYFGSVTEDAVKALQEKFTDEILAPAGLSAGTGYVGQKTIEKLNTLLGN